jgi:hypothetical protein
MLAKRVASPVTISRLFFSTTPEKSVAADLGGLPLSGDMTRRGAFPSQVDRVHLGERKHLLIGIAGLRRGHLFQPAHQFAVDARLGCVLRFLLQAPGEVLLIGKAVAAFVLAVTVQILCTLHTAQRVEVSAELSQRAVRCHEAFGQLGASEAALAFRD